MLSYSITSNSVSLSVYAMNLLWSQEVVDWTVPWHNMFLGIPKRGSIWAQGSQKWPTEETSGCSQGHTHRYMHTHMHILFGSSWDRLFRFSTSSEWFKLRCLNHNRASSMLVEKACKGKCPFGSSPENCIPSRAFCPVWICTAQSNAEVTQAGWLLV